MKFRQNEFYAIEGNLLNLLIKYHNFDCQNNNDNYNLPIVFKHVLNRIVAETIELDCQENRCSFNKERENNDG